MVAAKGGEGCGAWPVDLLECHCVCTTNLCECTRLVTCLLAKLCRVFCVVGHDKSVSRDFLDFFPCAHGRGQLARIRLVVYGQGTKTKRIACMFHLQSIIKLLYCLVKVTMTKQHFLTRLLSKRFSKS